MATQSSVGEKNKAGQTITDPWQMMHDAERTPCFFTGSEVIKEALRRANCDIMIAYPITPQSEAAALAGELFAEGFIGDYFRGESEFAVMSQCAGAAFGGARVFTTTAGPGTMRAMENFPMWAGARLPIQMIVTCRGINSPLSIQPDTLEISYLLNTGMLVWHAETAQDFYDWILKGYMVSEEPDVHLPLALCCDGFFVTHTKDMVSLTPADMCLPPYDPYRSPVPCMDMECPPVRMMRDPFIMKSNYISYATHASWQQEVWAAVERSRKHTVRWLDGLIEVENPGAEILLVSSGTAVSQGREAKVLLEEEGIDVGIVKIKSLRPWPGEEIREATKNAKHIIVPEFNVTGWMAREIKATIPNSERVYAGPRVCGGMTLPPEIIAADIKTLLGIKNKALAGRGS
ncbi:MAG: ferredoxin oxidoreductase [Nitrospirae bacterium]|nr:ferredoxin oxidoreductase [Nitrospirota bacterium]MDA1302780.1 ferredoxin oxidoreductase [Nitrospirota bacterium]